MERKTKTQVKEAEIVMDEVIDLTEKKTKEKSELKVINDNVVKARCPYTSSTTSSYALWYDAVVEPTVTP